MYFFTLIDQNLHSKLKSLQTRVKPLNWLSSARFQAMLAFCYYGFFTLQFKVHITLERTPQPKVYQIYTPDMMDSHDPRRFLRIPLAPQITKIVVIKKLDQNGQLISEGKKQITSIAA